MNRNDLSVEEVEVLKQALLDYWHACNDSVSYFAEQKKKEIPQSWAFRGNSAAEKRYSERAVTAHNLLRKLEGFAG